MKKFEEIRIVYYGTPEFAVASLKALVEAGANVVGVVTAPDKPAGRGKQLQASDVKKYALEAGLNILQPTNMKHEGFIEELKGLCADLQVVVAFRMMPEVVWNMPPMGTINVHGSLLPQYRGAAPINWAIINGEQETGVTTFKLKHEIDTGDILLQRKVPIGEHDNLGKIYELLMNEGAALLVETVKGLAAGTLNEIPQKDIAVENLKAAPKIFKPDTKIDWSKNVMDIYNLIRGLSPYPCAYTDLQDSTMKIYSASYEVASHNAAIGSYETDNKTYLKFAASDGWIAVEDMQLQGKKRMDIASFLRGFRG
ncbi:MAG: methionyl-tRNA formyltransferase [Flavipsychrobacter sp.]